MSQQQPRTVILHGGLDLVTPAINIPPGRAISAKNYVPEARGYRRLRGYERYDGRSKPSLAQYHILNFDAGITAISDGDTVTGATSGATAVALADGVLESGSYAGTDAAGYVVLGDITGTFQDNEELQVSATTVADANGTPVSGGASTDTLDLSYTKLAAAERRALIAAVPGSGPVRGVWTYRGDIYAFRDNAGATAGVMHKATSSGWSAQDLGSRLPFNAGTANFAEGETLTGGTSGATATIERVVVISGTWGGNDAEGYLALSGITGTFNSSETITGGTSSGSATTTASQTANTLPTGGRYDFINHNFYGTAANERMYGVNGVGRAFEWDGTTFAPIYTGLSDVLDKPIRVEELENHLFLFYVQGSATFMGIGNPLDPSTTGGAGEIGFGNEITDALGQASTSLLVFGKSKIAYITGTSAADFAMPEITDEAGALAWTAQQVGGPIFQDNRGLRNLSTTQAFGDWNLGTYTDLIEPIFTAKEKNNIAPTASLRHRSRNQYWVFFADNTAIVGYFGRKMAEFMPVELEIGVECASSGLDSDGHEIMLLGADDGFVYELEAGRSFDGSSIEATLRTAFDNFKQPQWDKRFIKATVEVDADSTTGLEVSAEFAYSNAASVSKQAQTLSILGGGGFWDEFFWDQFTWDAQVQGQGYVDVNGLGVNISYLFRSDSDQEDPHTITSITTNWSQRKMVR